ncbi:uncharacterized protein [Procambarus clarkii]|uniref:uncharacterized protein n=1 Tax=Procambarus clarkii TaxID=6728 RepID=UPI00374314E9
MATLEKTRRTLKGFQNHLSRLLDKCDNCLGTDSVDIFSRPTPKQAPSSDEIHELPQNEENPLINTDPHTGSTTEVQPSFSTISSNTTSRNESFTESDKFSDSSSQYSLDSKNSMLEATELTSFSQEPREISEAADETPSEAATASESVPEIENRAEAATEAVIKAEAKQEALSNTSNSHNCSHQLSRNGNILSMQDIFAGLRNIINQSASQAFNKSSECTETIPTSISLPDTPKVTLPLGRFPHNIKYIKKQNKTLRTAPN